SPRPAPFPGVDGHDAGSDRPFTGVDQRPRTKRAHRGDVEGVRGVAWRAQPRALRPQWEPRRLDARRGIRERLLGAAKTSDREDVADADDWFADEAGD